MITINTLINLQINTHLFLVLRLRSGLTVSGAELLAQEGGEIIPPNHQNGIIPLVTGETEIVPPSNYPTYLPNDSLGWLDIIGCFCHNLFLAPIKLVNTVGNGLTDMITYIIPSTPEAFKIGSICTEIATQHPLVWKLSGEIVVTMTPMITTLAVVKAWKIWRPI